MDDEGEEISRRRRLKPETFVRSGLTSSCATPRHHWRNPSWNSSSQGSGGGSGIDRTPTPFARLVAPHVPPPDDGCSSSSASSSSSSSSELLCPPLQSLSVAEPDHQQGQQQPMKKRVPMKLDLGALTKGSSYEQQQEHDPGGGDGVASPQLSESDNELRIRREKMAECDRQCTRILGHLYFGSKTVAENYTMLRRFRITHVLNCVGMVCPSYFPNDFFYKTLGLQDSPSEDLTCVLYDVFDFIEDVREQAGGRVFVHCSQGVSRSASLVIAYVMWRERRGFEQVFEDIKSRRSVTSPNIGFVFQLSQWQHRILDAAKARSTSQLYRIAPHSQYDPLLLLPKSVPGPPSLDALDSRGVFVVQLPNRLYVWRGRASDKPMAAAADRAAFQLVRYEHAQGPIVVIAEGREPPFLINALKREQLVGVVAGSTEPRQGGAYAAQINHAQGRARFGLKIVPAYSADYDMYNRAKAGSGGADYNNLGGGGGGGGGGGVTGVAAAGSATTPRAASSAALAWPSSARVGRWRVMRPEMSYASKW